MWTPEHGQYKFPATVELLKPEKLEGESAVMYPLQLKMKDLNKKGKKIRFERDKYFGW
jgi:hypothetical protein